MGGLIGVSGLGIRSYHADGGATIDTGISEKGLLIIGNDDYYTGKISAIINNHSDMDVVFLGNNYTPHLKIFKEKKDGSIKVTNTVEDYSFYIYIRIYPL